MTSRDLFISHSSGDSDVARELRAVLEAAGYSCWMAPDDVDASGTWTEQILGAIDSSRAMVVLISAHANASQHVSREVNLALGRKRVVLPIRIEPVPPSGSLEYLLSLVQRIDAFPPPISAHRDQILRRLETVVRREAEAPPAEPVAAASTAVDAGGPAPSEPTVSEPAAPERIADAPSSESLHLRALAAGGALDAGSRIGAFTIESLLGEGGMATVYKARQDEPSRAVALKVIRADHAADPTYRERFLAEKDTLASLEHQSIVPIYAAGEASGMLYIAMRLVDGADLTAKLVASGRLTLAETISVLEPIADAVDYAHEMGVIHRDLKPSNIILDRRGRPYLTDFGLGKRIDGSRGLSAPGVAVGTLEYMAPEQFTGLIEPDLAGRIDIYALACVAFLCLTAASPFQRESPERVMYAHAHEAIPSLRAARPDLPAGVDKVLAKALTKNPAERFASAREFISALAAAAAAAEGQTAAIVPLTGNESGRGRRAWLSSNRPLAGIAAAAIVAVAVVGGGVLAFGPGPSTTPTPVPAGSLTAVASFVTPTSGPTLGPTNTPFELPPTDGPKAGPTPPPPTPTPDLQAPTGAKVTITAGTVYLPTVNLNLFASGATQMRVGTATSATSSCSLGSWRSYSNTYSGLAIAGGVAGTRWACAQFRDAAENATGFVKDSVIFDNPPVARTSANTTFGFSAATLSGKTSITLVFFDPAYGTPIASDPDGLATLKVTKLWLKNSNGTTTDVSSTLTFGGTRATFGITQPYCGSATTFYYGFTVVDNYNGRDTGSFGLHVCY